MQSLACYFATYRYYDYQNYGRRVRPFRRFHCDHQLLQGHHVQNVRNRLVLAVLDHHSGLQSPCNSDVDCLHGTFVREVCHQLSRPDHDAVLPL